MFLSSRCSSPAPSQAAREASRLPHGRQGGPRRPSAAITSRLRRISKKVNLWKIARAPCCGEGARHRKVIREGTLREIGRDARVIHGGKSEYSGGAAPLPTASGSIQRIAGRSRTTCSVTDSTGLSPTRGRQLDPQLGLGGRRLYSA